MSSDYWAAQAIRRRRLSRRAFLGAVGATTAGLALTACGGGGGSDKSSGEQGGTQTATKQPKKGGTLVALSTGSALHFDQHQLPGIAGDGHVYNQMLKLGDGQKILNDLTTGWETPDSNTYIFHLTQGVKFQNVDPVNGREMVAEDVVYTVKRAATDDPAFSNRWMWTELTSLEAPDKYTVKATFKEPFAPALYHFAAGSMGVIAKEVVDKFGDLKQAESRIGTGPFLLSEYRRDDILKYRRNPDYWEPDFPRLDGIDLPIMPDRSARLVAFRSGQVDMIPWQSGISDKEEASRGLSDVDVRLRPSDAIYALGFNHSLETLKDYRARKAISLVIDHRDLIQAAGGDDAGALAGMVHPHGEPFALPGDELEKLMTPDVAQAKQLLTAAGYDSGFDLGMTVRSDPTDLDVAAVMQQQLAQVNIKLKLDTQEIATFVNKLRGKTFDTILIFAWTPALDPGQQFHGSLRSDSAQNWWFANVPEIDQLDDQQVRELDLDKRADLIRQLERVNLDKVVALPLYVPNGWVALRTFIQSYDHTRATNALGWQDKEVWLDKA